MKQFEQADRIHLNAAEGWLGLGDLESAHEELEQITTEFRVHPAVLLTRCKIYQAAKKWDYVISISSTLVEQLPRLADAWIHRSYALHELKRTREAHDLLLPAAKRFPKLWVVRYNLACYACQLGNLEDAVKLLVQAIDLGGKDGDSIGRFLLGQISEAEVLNAAKTTGMCLGNAQQCEAFYYMGEKRLLGGDKTGAADFFQKCVATGHKEYTEYQSAVVELAALEASDVTMPLKQ